MTDRRLARLAAAHGVATRYRDAAQRTVTVGADTVRATLAALGVDPDGPPPPDGLGPAVVVSGAGRRHRIRVPAGAGPAEVIGEDGTRTAAVVDRDVLELPPLPLGYHRLEVGRAGSVHLVVAPRRLELPPGRLWGWQVQLYATRSAGSWGVGDFADLAATLEWAARGGAGLALVSPLGAVAPAHPLENSPYYPSSRRFVSPLYLRPQDTAGYAAADPSLRGRVDDLAASVPREGRIDRDAAWAAKRAACELLAPDPIPAPPAGALADFAAFCSAAERHGRDFRRWPARAGRDVDPARVAFHAWLQGECEHQLRTAQERARAAGMPVGVVHDLPVGVDPGGADARALADALASQVTVGAPPDLFNQQGQDWRLAPWHPRRLAELGYQPFREVVAATLRRGGGIRVDHVMGLFRLWWIPPGRDPAEGTYVRYDPAGMLGVLALEAHRHGGIVVGEDLGTVERSAQTALGRRGVLGSTVLWFEREPPERWRSDAAASVTTHDLPTAAGFLAGEHIRLRARLGLLTRPEREEAAEWRAHRDDLLALAARLGYPHDPVAGLHAALVRSPSRVVLAALGDAVGDLRQPNLPGTTDAYPNWRLPLAGPDGREVGLEGLLASAGAARLAGILSAVSAPRQGLSPHDVVGENAPKQGR